jgi:hypothetical protein
MPNKFDKWFPKFPTSNVITAKEHINTFYACFQNHPLNNDDEDVDMKLFVSSLVENERKWYNNFPDKSIKTWQTSHDTFMKRWGTKKDGKMLLVQFNEMKKKENGWVKEFDTGYENLLKKIHYGVIPKDDVILLQYKNDFEGKFIFMLKDKSPKTLVEAKELVAKIEEKLFASKVQPFHVPRAKDETKPRIMNNFEPTQDSMTLLDQRLEKTTTESLQNQSLIMNKVTNLERAQQQNVLPRS